MTTRPTPNTPASTSAATPLAVIQPASRHSQAEFLKVFDSLYKTREELLTIDDRTSSNYKAVLFDFLEQMVRRQQRSWTSAGC